MRISKDPIAHSLFLCLVGLILIIAAITNWATIVDGNPIFNKYSESTRRLIYGGIGLLLLIIFGIDVLKFIFPT